MEIRTRNSMTIQDPNRYRAQILHKLRIPIYNKMELPS